MSPTLLGEEEQQWEPQELRRLLGVEDDQDQSQSQVPECQSQVPERQSQNQVPERQSQNQVPER